MRKHVQRFCTDCYLHRNNINLNVDICNSVLNNILKPEGRNIGAKGDVNF
jgi:hypothetical protein